MKQLLETAKRASARDSKVLIRGETGVGKCARPIHPHLVTARGASIRCRQLRRLAETLLEIGAVRCSSRQVRVAQVSGREDEQLSPPDV